MAVNYKLSSGTKSLMHQANMAKASMPGLAQGIGYVAGSIEQAQAEAEAKKLQEEEKRADLESGWAESFDSVVARRDFEQGPYFDQWKSIEEENKELFLGAETNSERFDILKAQRARTASMTEMKEIIQLAQTNDGLTAISVLEPEELELWQHINTGKDVTLGTTEENDVTLSYGGKEYTSADIDKIIAKATLDTVTQEKALDIFAANKKLAKAEGASWVDYEQEDIYNSFASMVTAKNQVQLLRQPGIIFSESMAEVLKTSPGFSAPIEMDTESMKALAKTVGNKDESLDAAELKTLIELDDSDKNHILKLLELPENLPLLRTLVAEAGEQKTYDAFKARLEGKENAQDPNENPTVPGELDPQ